MNQAEKFAVEAQLRETGRRLNEVSEFYGALSLDAQARDEMREAMDGYSLATTRIMDLLANAIRIGRDTSARDDAEIQRNHRMRLAAMSTLMGIAAEAAIH